MAAESSWFGTGQSVGDHHSAFRYRVRDDDQDAFYECHDLVGKVDASVVDGGAKSDEESVELTRCTTIDRDHADTVGDQAARAWHLHAWSRTTDAACLKRGRAGDLIGVFDAGSF